MLGRFWDYATAVLPFWQFWVAVALMAERVFERLYPNFWRWAEPYFTPTTRRRLLLTTAVLSFVYANFRAFDEERAAKDRAIATAPQSMSALQYFWPRLTPSEKSALRSEFSVALRHAGNLSTSMKVVCIEITCRALADDLIAVFDSAGWNAQLLYGGSIPGEFSEAQGLAIWSDDEAARDIQAAVRLATGMDVRILQMPRRGQPASFFVVGQKPR